MKKVFILDFEGDKKVFFTLNNLKKYLKENIFLKLELSMKEVKEQISEINYINSYNGDFRQFNYEFSDIKIYSLKEYGIIT